MINKFVFMIATRILYLGIVLFVFTRLDGRMEKMLVSLFGVLYVAIESTVLLRVKSNDAVRLEIAELRAVVDAIANPNVVRIGSILDSARAALEDEKRGSGIHAAYLLIVMAICLLEFFKTIAS